MADTSRDRIPAPTRRDIAYFRQRQKNRVFEALAAFFAQEAEAGRISRKALAERLDKDPAQITRWLAAPSNFELDTISDILLALGAEMDLRIVRISGPAAEAVQPKAARADPGGGAGPHMGPQADTAEARPASPGRPTTGEMKKPSAGPGRSSPRRLARRDKAR